MAYLFPHNVAHSSPRSSISSFHHSGNLQRHPCNEQRDLMLKPKLYDSQARHSYFGNAQNGERHPNHEFAGFPPGSSYDYTKGNICSCPQKQEPWWASEMDQYLAASRLCREEAMACLLQAAGAHWPFAERGNRKKVRHKLLLRTCQALNAGTNKSWRGLKKLFSKQFMPFSNRDHHGLHHINTTISKRSSKALNVGGRKMDARVQLGASKSEAILGRKNLCGKENIVQNGDAIREPFGLHENKYGSKFGELLWEKKWALQKGKLKMGGSKKKLRILLRKASGVAIGVCDFLNLE